MSLGAKLSLTEQLTQKLDRQRSHLSVECGVYKYKLLDCRDKILSLTSLIKAHQQSFLTLKGSEVPIVQGHVERILSDNSEKLNEILTICGIV